MYGETVALSKFLFSKTQCPHQEGMPKKKTKRSGLHICLSIFLELLVCSVTSTSRLGIEGVSLSPNTSHSELISEHIVLYGTEVASKTDSGTFSHFSCTTNTTLNRGLLFCFVCTMIETMLLMLHAGALLPMPTWTDNLVLQSTDDSGTAASVYGAGCSAGEVVTLSAAGLPTVQAKADAEGDWTMSVPHASGGTYTVTLSGCGSNSTVRNVRFGDVFICSGQSNMVLPVSAVDNASGIAADASALPLFLWRINSSIVPDLVNKTYPQKQYAVQFDWNPVATDVVMDFSAICLLAAIEVAKQKPGRPLGLIQSAVGGSPVQSWCPDEALAACNVANPMPIQSKQNSTQYSYNYGGTLFNQILSPLVGTSVRSVMWYQGEANMNEGYHLTRGNYRCLFMNMISSWRRAFKQAFPFNLVQLHACDSGNTGQCYADFCNYGDIRMAQDDVQRTLPDIGLAVSYDQGSSTIHSKHKTLVGQRLGWKVLETAYPKSAVNADGPVLQSACVSQLPTLSGASHIAQVRLRLDNNKKISLVPSTECLVQSPTCCNVTQAGLEGVAYGIAQVSTGSVWTGDTWHSATIQPDGTDLLLNIDLGASYDTNNPIWEVRYAHGAFPSCAVVNDMGIPIKPFGPLAVSPLCAE